MPAALPPAADPIPPLPGGKTEGAGPYRRTPIKGNVKRTVFHGRGADGIDRMVKVFHAPGLGAWRDRSRARREARNMTAARAAGLPVAEVLGVSKEQGSWSLTARWIPGCSPLDEVLGAPRQGRVPGGSRCRRSPLARALGALIAKAQARGFVHGDPHPGNVLVADDGQLWLVDLSGARLGRPSASVVESLERGASALRETNARFLVSVFRWWRKEAQKLGLDPLPEPRAMDDAARAYRLAAASRRVRVWRRTSTPTCVTEVDGRPVVRVRAPEAPPPHWSFERKEYVSKAQARRAWGRLVRARLHHLPAARPVSASLAAPWYVEYAVPPGTSPTSGPPDSELRALLRHRGLCVDGPLLEDGKGSSFIGPATLITVERAR